MIISNLIDTSEIVKTVRGAEDRRQRGLAVSAAVATLMASFLGQAPRAVAEPTAAPIEALSAAHTASASDVYTALTGKPGNVVLSPLSIGTAMSMLLSGARGETQTELSMILHHTLAPADIAEASGALAAKLVPDAKAASPSRLLTANALMITSKTDNISEDYTALLASKYGAEVFAGAKLDDINGWVAKKTEDKIPKILDKLDDDSEAVILNAVYFKSAWAEPFNPALTTESPFTAGGTKAIKVPTMHAERRLPIVEGKGYRATRIPYSDPALGLVVVLPNEAGGLGAVADSLKGAAVRALLDELQTASPNPVALALPRFKAELGSDLLEVFASLGLKPEGDYSAITKEGPIKIGQIMHKALIEVNEEGTEAAAATAVEMVGRSMQPAPKPVPFVVDRPFLFLLTDQNTGAVLFMGRIDDPSA